MKSESKDFLLALADRIEHAGIMEDINASEVLRQIVIDEPSRVHLLSDDNFDSVKTLQSLIGADEEQRKLFSLGMRYAQWMRDSLSKLTPSQLIDFTKSLDKFESNSNYIAEDDFNTAIGAIPSIKSTIKQTPWYKFW